MHGSKRAGWAFAAAFGLALAGLVGPQGPGGPAGGAPAAGASDMAGAFSILLRDPATGEIGIAAFSHAPSCGAWVPWLDANVGAVATQGDIEASWGPRALAMLGRGVRPEAIVDSLRATDPGNFRRQLGLLDRNGWPGGYSGPHLVNWSGGWLDSNLAVQGNTLPGHEALDAVVDTLYRTKGWPLAARLLDGLSLARAARADFRGPRSAVLVIGRANPDRPQDATRYVSLRVDDDPDPVGALRRQYANWRAGRLVAARLDDRAHAAARGDTLAARAALADAARMVEASLADTAVSASSLNAMAWALAQHDALLDRAWAACARARHAEPRSNEFADTAAEIRLRQGRPRDAYEIEREAQKRVPLDDYLKDRVETMRKQAGLPPDTAQAKKPAPRRPPPRKR